MYYNEAGVWSYELPVSIILSKYRDARGTEEETNKIHEIVEIVD
jgi:hypothetical protein